MPPPKQDLRKALARGMADPLLFVLILSDPQEGFDDIGSIAIGQVSRRDSTLKR